MMGAGAFRGCKFCGGRGCLACPGERAKHDADADDRPELIATFDPEDEKDMAAFYECYGPESIEGAFRRPDGSIDQEGGTRIIVEKLRRIRPSVLEVD